MQITRQADYAIRAVRYLAKQGPNERAATSTVAQEMKNPAVLPGKIISQCPLLDYCTPAAVHAAG